MHYFLTNILDSIGLSVMCGIEMIISKKLGIKMEISQSIIMLIILLNYFRRLLILKILTPISKCITIIVLTIIYIKKIQSLRSMRLNIFCSQFIFLWLIFAKKNKTR